MLIQSLHDFLRRNYGLLILEIGLLVGLNAILAGHCVLHLDQVQIEILLDVLLGEGGTWLVLNHNRVVQLLTRRFQLGLQRVLLSNIRWRVEVIL